MTEIALVTGGAGLVGSHIVDELLSLGLEVKIIDSLHPQTHPKGKPNWIPREVEFLHADIRDLNSLEKVVKKVSYIFHQASFGGFTSEMSTYFDVNVTGTARIFEAIQNTKANINSIVVATSQAIFGELEYLDVSTGEKFQPPLRSISNLQKSIWEHHSISGKELIPLPAQEDLDQNGVTPYALSKIGQEATSLGFGRAMKIPVKCIRYGVTYGPRQSLSNPYTGVISIFSNRIRNGKNPVIYEDGNQTRDFVFVKDQAKLNINLAMDQLSDQLVLNSGTGKRTSMMELGMLISKKLNGPLPIIAKQFRPGDARHFFHSTEKLRSLGYENRTSIENGISEFLDWLISQPNFGDGFEESQKELIKRGVLFDQDY